MSCNTSISKTFNFCVDLKSVIILVIPPCLSIIFIPYYAYFHGFNIFDWIWFSFFMIATGLSITMGYHRLWSHRAYNAHILLKIFFMLFGACALQNSIIKWASDHRKHHRFVDSVDKDPYSVSKGFWYSHIFWMMRVLPKNISKIENVDDLKQDKIITLQHTYYFPISIFMCFILPLLIGVSYNHTFGCFLLSGILRLVLNHHFTFFINSAAHTWGKQIYSDNNTSRDNPFLSLFTYGEGYHNFHHKYPGDYRNGIKWYDFDPSKWLVSFFSTIGLTYNLKRTSIFTIEASKAYMQFKKITTILNNKKHYYQHYVCCDINKLEQRITIHYKIFFNSIKAWYVAKQSCLFAKKQKVSAYKLLALKKRYRVLKKYFKCERKTWRAVTATKLYINIQQ